MHILVLLLECFPEVAYIISTHSMGLIRDTTTSNLGMWKMKFSSWATNEPANTWQFS